MVALHMEFGGDLYMICIVRLVQPRVAGDHKIQRLLIDGFEAKGDDLLAHRRMALKYFQRQVLGRLMKGQR